MLSVSILDDDPKIIDFFRETTFDTPDVVCVKTAQTIEDYFMQPLKDEGADHFLFLDVHLGDISGIASIPEILESYPKIEIIIYSVDEEYHHLITAFKLGAVGYIIKQFNRELLVSYFEILSKGGAAISPQMAKKLIYSVNESRIDKQLAKRFSTKELQLLSLLSEGWTYQYIADNMDMSVDGVRYYIKKIYKKMKVNSRAEAVKVFQNLR